MNLKHIKKMINLYGHDTVFIYSNVSRYNRRIAYVQWCGDNKIWFFTELQEAFEWNDFSNKEKCTLASDIYREIMHQLGEEVRIAQNKLEQVEATWYK